MGHEIRVLIADDHPIFRQGLRLIIEAQRELTVVAIRRAYSHADVPLSGVPKQQRLKTGQDHHEQRRS